MADGTNIEWTDASWSPIRARYWEIQDDGSGKERIGWHCTHVSEGCRNCYAERINRRLGTGRDYAPDELYREENKWHRNGEVKLFLDEKMLTQPLRWKKPRRIFVCSMTDLFVDGVADEWIDRIFAVMALCPQHTFQVLTKRADRMRNYCLGASDADRRVWAAANEIMDTIWALAQHGASWGGETPWPLRNVWLGVSVEDQKHADERIPMLLETPAAEHFISAEPLLGPLDIRQWLGPREIKGPDCYWLDWVIVGGESGSGARPMHPEWARKLRGDCVLADVPFFFKQWGEWQPHTVVAGGDLGADMRADRVRIVHPSARSNVEISVATGGYSTEPGSRYMARVGKKAAGRLLDGREWSEFPQ